MSLETISLYERTIQRWLHVSVTRRSLKCQGSGFVTSFYSLSAKLVVIYQNAEPTCLKRHDDCETNFCFKHAFWSIVDRNNGASSPNVFFSTRRIWRYPGWSFFFLSVSWIDDAPSSSSNTIFFFPWFFLQRKDKKSCLMADFCRRVLPQGSVWVVGREWLIRLPDCPKTVFPLMERLH